MESSKSKKIIVKTLVEVSLQKTWDCFTNPGHITGWYFAADTWHAPKAENDLRPGGRFTITMAAKDGSASFDFSGIYSEVSTYEKISYELADGRKVSIRFSDTGNGILVSEEFDPENVNSEERQRSGWQSILDNFKKYAENSYKVENMKKKDPVVHFEMPARDRERMAKFYESAFGWTYQFLGNDMGNYVTVQTAETDENRMITRPGAINGGFYPVEASTPMPAPSLVIAVENLNESLKLIKSSGGSMLGEPTDIPGIGKFVAFLDTEGNRVAILQPLQM